MTEWYWEIDGWIVLVGLLSACSCALLGNYLEGVDGRRPGARIHLDLDPIDAERRQGHPFPPADGFFHLRRSLSALPVEHGL